MKKLVFYKRLLVDDVGLTPTEKMLYSYLVNVAISQTDDVFDKEDGSYCSSVLDELETLDLPPLYQNEIARQFKVFSQGAISLAYKGLKAKHIIDETSQSIQLNKLHSCGYFTIDVECGLRGELLIFYSWLKDLGKGGNILATMEKLSSMYNVRLTNIRDYLFRLRSKNYIMRNEKGNIVLLK